MPFLNWLSAARAIKTICCSRNGVCQQNVQMIQVANIFCNDWRTSVIDVQPVQGARSLSPKNSLANLRTDSQAAANNFVTSLTVGINLHAADKFSDADAE